MEPKVKELVDDIKGSLKQELAPAITEDVMKKIEEKLPLRKGIFGGTASEEQELREKKDAAAEAVRKLARGEVKALTSGTSGSGSELVPTYISDEIIRMAEKVGLVRQYARKWPMQGIKENIPTMSSVTAYRVNEGAKITSSQPSTTGGVNLSAKTTGVLIPISKKLLLGANPAVVDALNLLAAEALAKIEDKWAFLGLASGEGVFQHASVPGVTMAATNTTYAKATAEDVLDVIDKLDMNAVDDRVRWVMHLSVLNVFRKLRAAVGTDKQGFLFQGFGGSTPPTIWDIPYSLNPVMPKTSDGSQAGTKFIALVNFAHVIFGDAQQYTLEISDQATITDTDGTTLINLFEQNMVALKVSGEVDIQLSQPDKAFAWLKTAAA